MALRITIECCKSNAIDTARPELVEGRELPAALRSCFDKLSMSGAFFTFATLNNIKISDFLRRLGKVLFYSCRAAYEEKLFSLIFLWLRCLSPAGTAGRVRSPKKKVFPIGSSRIKKNFAQPGVCVLTFLTIGSIFIAAYFIQANNGGIFNQSGSPGDGSNCTSCHGGGGFTPGVSLSGLPVSYVAGQSYSLTVTVSGGTKHGFGFTSEKAGGTKVGSFTAGAGSQVSGINLTHNSGQVSNPATWTFTWTAPSAGQGTVTLYAAGNATNNNGSTSGDNVTTGNWSVLEDNVSPGGISSLTALSGSNAGEIQLNWTAPGNDGTSYNFTGAYVIKYSSVGIIRSADFDSPPASLAAGSVALSTSSVLPGTGVGRLFTGLNEGARYWFAIKSTDSSRNVSVWNSSADVATVNLLLSTSATASSPSPRNVSFFAVAVGSASLRWDLISGNSYVAVFSTSSDFVGTNTSSGTASLNQNTTSYSGLEPNNLYYFKVKLSSQSDSFYSTAISSYTLPRSPALSSFRVFKTSITVVSLSNGNPVGTVWAISTGSFDSSNSSQTSRLAGDPQTPLTLTNLISNSSYTLNLRAVNFGNVPSSTTMITSTFTLPAAPGTITFDSISKDAITLSWGANGNSLTPPTSYQVQVSSNDSAFATRTTSDTFRLNLTTSSLSPLTTYYFRIFAYGSGGTNSAFGDTVSTRTRFTQVILSTGGTLVTGGVSLTAEAGVQVTLEELSDGQIQHTILSTQTAHLAYGNGFSLDLPRSVEARILPTSSGLTFTSTRSVPISEGTFTVEPSSGTATLVNSAGSLSVSLATGAIQNILASVPASSAKSLSISLNPASGEIKMDLPKAALSDAVQLRMKIPDSLPAALSQLSSIRSLGIGLEILLDKAIQPVKKVPLVFTYRDSDLGGANTSSLSCSRFDENAQVWTLVPSSIDTLTRRVTAQTKHFSKFQIVAASPASEVGQAKVFPNPFRPFQGHTQIKFTNLPPATTIKIFSFSGNMVRELSTDANGQAVWNGKNSAGHDLASDIYLALIEGPGGKQIVKVGVQR